MSPFNSDILVSQISSRLETTVDPLYVNLSEIKNLEGWRGLEIHNATVSGNWTLGGQLNASARDNVVLKDESHLQHGSEVHLFIDNMIFQDCIQWDGIGIHYAQRKRFQEDGSLSNKSINLRFVKTNDCFIYPNPGNGYYFISFESLSFNDPVNCTIKNCQGSTLLTTTFYEPDSKIDLTRLNPGLYFILFNNKNINVIKKIIKL